MKTEMKPAFGGNENWKARPAGMPPAPGPLKKLGAYLPWSRRVRWRLRLLRDWHGWKPLLIGCQLFALLGLFLWSGPLLRLIDPTAASMDAGIISVLLLAVLVVDTFVLSAWLLLRLLRDILPVVDDRGEEDDEFFTQKLEPCLEAKILTGSFWGLVLLSVFVFTVLL